MQNKYSLPTLSRRQYGFTMVELITVIVILGILAAVAAPRFFEVNVFKSRGFSDEVKAVLRFAQKTAIAQRKFVCVALDSNSVTLTIDLTTNPSVTTSTTCPATALQIPGKGTNRVSSNDATFTTSPSMTSFYFNAAGKPSFTATVTFDVNGNAFKIENETGYVH